jgi:hypothetical protein
MSPTEKKIAAEIGAYLATRGDRIASDLGLLVFREAAGVLVAEVGGGTFEIAIVVTKAANDNTGRR